MAKNKKWKRSQNKVMEKIHGRYELDKKGDIRTDYWGKRIRKSFLKVIGMVHVVSFRTKPSIGKHSDMTEMKAHRLDMLKKREAANEKGTRPDNDC